MNTKQPVKQVIYFNECSLVSLEKQFLLKIVRDSKLLKEWFDYCLMDNMEVANKAIIEQSRQILIKNVHDWNEYELAMYFIGPILSLINFSTPPLNLFAQRSLTTTLNDIVLTGKPDGLIAIGHRKPELPLFCLHIKPENKIPITIEEEEEDSEYKCDPAGQVLAAMLVAQTQNKAILGDQSMPIYGCYVVGRAWYFMVLEGSEYAISDAYLATKIDDLLPIVKLLKGLKMLLLKQVAQLNI